MLMQVQSGLSQAQVQKKQFDLRHAAGALTPVFPVRPIAMLSIGLGLLAEALGGQAWLGLIPAVLVFGVSVFGHWQFARWLAGFNQDRTVLVVRDGLRRAVKMSALVGGDRLEIPAGTILPLDVVTTAAATPTHWLRVVLALTGQTMPSGVALAGCRLSATTQVEVLATGDNRFIASLTRDMFSHVAPLAVLSLVKQWVHQVGLALILGGRRLVRGLQQSGRLAAPAPVASSTGFVLSGIRQSLVGKRMAAREAAFRYNQDPVTSPRPLVLSPIM